MTAKLRAGAGALVLIGSLTLVMLAIPGASAHACTAENPETECGPCTAGDHDHRYNTGQIYCMSNDGCLGTSPFCPGLPPVLCC